jgi:hypothetical protein
MFRSGLVEGRNMVDKNTYRIFRHNATFNAPEFVAADGHGYTLHLDKAAAFPTLDNARWTQRIHFPDHHIDDERRCIEILIYGAIGTKGR